MVKEWLDLPKEQAAYDYTGLPSINSSNVVGSFDFFVLTFDGAGFFLFWGRPMVEEFKWGKERKCREKESRQIYSQSFSSELELCYSPMPK